MTIHLIVIFVLLASSLQQPSVSSSQILSSPVVVVTPPPSAQYRSQLRPPSSVKRLQPTTFPLSAKKPAEALEPLSLQRGWKPKEEIYVGRNRDNERLASSLKFRPNYFNNSHIMPPSQARETLSSNPFANRGTQPGAQYPTLAASMSNLSYSYNSPQQQTKEILHGINSVQMSSSHLQQSASRQISSGQCPSMPGSLSSSTLRIPIAHHHSPSSLLQYQTQNNLQTSRVSPVRNVARSELDEIDDLMLRLKGKQVRVGGL